MPSPKMVITVPDKGRQTYLISKLPLVIGSGDQCHIQITAAQHVGARHLRLVQDATVNLLVAEDLDSGSPTMCRGNRVTRHIIVHSDRLTIGDAHLNFYYPIDAPPGSELELFMLGGPLAGQVFLLTDTVSIGRLEGNTICVMKNSVSGKHATIQMNAGKAFITDLNSRNGTKVNGSAISPNRPKQLEAGDIIDIGPLTILLQLAGTRTEPIEGSKDEDGADGPGGAAASGRIGSNVMDAVPPPPPPPAAASGGSSGRIQTFPAPPPTRGGRPAPSTPGSVPIPANATPPGGIPRPVPPPPPGSGRPMAPTAPAGGDPNRGFNIPSPNASGRAPGRGPENAGGTTVRGPVGGRNRPLTPPPVTPPAADDLAKANTIDYVPPPTPAAPPPPPARPAPPRPVRPIPPPARSSPGPRPPATMPPPSASGAGVAGGGSETLVDNNVYDDEKFVKRKGPLPGVPQLPMPTHQSETLVDQNVYDDSEFVKRAASTTPAVPRSAVPRSPIPPPRPATPTLGKEEGYIPPSSDADEIDLMALAAGAELPQSGRIIAAASPPTPPRSAAAADLLPFLQELPNPPRVVGPSLITLPSIPDDTGDGKDLHLGLPPAIRITERLTIGRRKTNALRLPHGEVSGEHAIVIQSAGGFALQDLGALNGTFINGERIPSNQVTTLEPHAELVIGPFRFLYIPAGEQFPPP